MHSTKDLIKGFCNFDSLISSHNCLILTLNHIWVHPLKKVIPKAAIKIQETHLHEVDTPCPKIFFPGHNQIISYASTDDPYGGMIISYTKALPKPINLLEIFLRSKASNTAIPKTGSGRLMILGFQTETSFLIVGSLYGHEQQSGPPYLVAVSIVILLVGRFRG